MIHLTYPLLTLLIVLSLLGGCGTLRPPATYTLDSIPSDASVHRRPHSPGSTLTLLISAPRAAPGFDSQRIIYLREAHKPEQFAYNEWVDTPARMILPLIIKALENEGAFHALVQAPNAADGDLRLDTEILRLQQEFSGTQSLVRFTLRASLVDNRSLRVLAQREFDASVSAPSADPQGGVLAANQAVNRVLGSLADFCAETAGRRR